MDNNLYADIGNCDLNHIIAKKFNHILTAANVIKRYSSDSQDKIFYQIMTACRKFKP